MCVEEKTIKINGILYAFLPRAELPCDLHSFIRYETQKSDVVKVELGIALPCKSYSLSGTRIGESD